MNMYTRKGIGTDKRTWNAQNVTSMKCHGITTLYGDACVNHLYTQKYPHVKTREQVTCVTTHTSCD